MNKVKVSLEHPVDKNDNSAFGSLKSIFEKSLAVNKNLPAGHVLTFDDLEAKKPKNFGIDAADFQSVVGKPLKNELKAWDFLTENDISIWVQLHEKYVR